MKRIAEFITPLSQDEVISVLRKNAYAVASGFQSMPFGNKYFSGRVNGSTIRLKNAIRKPKRPSPTLTISLKEQTEGTGITVFDNSTEEWIVHKQLALILTMPVSIVVLLVEAIWSWYHSDGLPLLWSGGLSVLLLFMAWINIYWYRSCLRSSTKADLAFITKLLLHRELVQIKGNDEFAY